MDVPYVPAACNTATDMIARRLTSTGTRALGKYPVRYAVPRGMSGFSPGFPQLSGYMGSPNIPYQAAKRMKLGALGLTSGQATTGLKAGLSAGTTAVSIGGSIASGIAGSAAAGAVAGSVVPVIGTAIGLIVGLLASGVFNRSDQEIQNFDQAVAIWAQNRNNVINIANKYLVLAGLFDLSLNNPHIPIYLQYGRKGEVNFVRDMINKIYQAATSGQITAADTPESVMSRIVQPWIDNWGKGPMVDPHADLINLIMIGMIAEYIAGQQTRWLARGGDFPFAGLPPFPLQQILAAANPPAVVGPAPVAPSPVPFSPPLTVVAPPLVVGVPSPPVAPPAAPTITAASQVSNTDNTTITGPTTLGLLNAQGHVFQLGTVAPNGFWIYVDGSLQGGQAVQLLLANSGTVYARNNQNSWYQWSPAAMTWQLLPGAPQVNAIVPQPNLSQPGAVAPPVATPVMLPPATAPVATPPPQPTFPPGFTLVGQDSNATPVYANAQGVLYQWTGAAMQAFTGQLSGGSAVQSQIQAAIQSALAQGQSQAQATQTAMQAAQSAGVQVTPQLQQQVQDQTAMTANSPPQVTAAGGGALSGNTGLLLVAGVLGALFLTARPARAHT